MTKAEKDSKGDPGAADIGLLHSFACGCALEDDNDDSANHVL